MEQETVVYERDIRPLFREKDMSSMSRASDLASYNDVRANVGRILRKLSEGRCTATALWPEERDDLLRGWVDADCPA